MRLRWRSFCLLIGLALTLSRFRQGSLALVVDDNNAPPAAVSNTETLWYSYLRRDRSGMAVQDMLHAHAFASYHGVGYGGACPPPGGKKTFRESHESLLKDLRLEHILPLPIDCPNGTRILDGMRDRYVQRDPYMNETWLEAMRSQLEVSPRKDDFRVAVHMRRGDITPCNKRWAFRYLTNAHYLRVLDSYLPTNLSAHVTIFSESKSMEPWDVFRDRGYELKLDTDIAEAWKEMATADLLILSRSSFGFVPAILNRHGSVVFTPYEVKQRTLSPLKDWIVVDKALVQRNLDEKGQLCAR